MKRLELPLARAKGFAPVLALVLLAGLGAPHSPARAASDDVQRALSDIQAGNYMSAAAALRQAATGGDPQAMFYLGDLAFNGTGVAQSYSDAIQWYCRAALANSEEAKRRLATIDLGGWSQERNAGGWQSACEQRLNPEPPKPVPVLPEAGTVEPDVSVAIYPEGEPGYESDVFPTYWPWYWYVPPLHPKPYGARVPLSHHRRVFLPHDGRVLLPHGGGVPFPHRPGLRAPHMYGPNRR